MVRLGVLEAVLMVLPEALTNTLKAPELSVEENEARCVTVLYVDPELRVYMALVTSPLAR